MKYKEKQKKYKPEILRLLDNKEYGMIATEIKEDLNHALSRNTIQSYLDQLAEEKLVHSVKIGRYELWFSKKKTQGHLKLQNHPLFAIFATFLDELEKDPANKDKDWKQLGLAIGKTFAFEPWFPNLKNLVVDDISKLFILSKELFPSILKQILLYFGDENAEVDPPIIQEEIYTIIIRIRGSNYADNKIFFPLVCGIEESDVAKSVPFSITFDVLQQIPEKKLVDLKIKLYPVK